jgi:hypothetical protein
MTLQQFSNGLSAFAIGGVALLSAFHLGRYVEQRADATRGNSPYDATESVSFNDGTQEPCPIIELTPTATRLDVADALASGARQVEIGGCVKFHFID